MIATLAVGSVLTVGGLRIDLPQDSAPALYGLDLEGRFQALSDVDFGLALAWSGGVNDTNPDRKLIAHRTQLLALLGYRLGDDALAARIAVRFGGMYVYAWPRGVLSRLTRLGPVGGVELSGEIGLGAGLLLAPFVGYEHLRLNQIGVDIPYFGLRFGGEVARLFTDDADG